jgi:hypothetical protein
MLKVIHQKEGAPRASSIYCRWIREERKDGEHLVAVWMDSEMRCFEREYSENSVEQLQHEDALDEPGGWAVPQSLTAAGV